MKLSITISISIGYHPLNGFSKWIFYCPLTLLNCLYPVCRKTPALAVGSVNI